MGKTEFLSLLEGHAPLPPSRACFTITSNWCWGNCLLGGFSTTFVYPCKLTTTALHFDVKYYLSHGKCCCMRQQLSVKSCPSYQDHRLLQKDKVYLLPLIKYRFLWRRGNRLSVNSNFRLTVLERKFVPWSNKRALILLVCSWLFCSCFHSNFYSNKENSAEIVSA